MFSYLEPFIIVLLILTIPAAALIVIIPLRHWNTLWGRVKLDIAESKVESICGPIVLDGLNPPATQKGGSQLGRRAFLDSSYKLNVNGSEFTITKRLWKAFSGHSECCIYYAAESKVILSADFWSIHQG
jgi:hypothetical protein